MLSKNDRRKANGTQKNWHARLEGTRELWRNHMKTWQESGLSQAAYCRQHQINQHKFLYWKKRILGKPAPATLTTFAELPNQIGPGYPEHHKCPHFHAVNPSGIEWIFPYMRGII